MPAFCSPTCRCLLTTPRNNGRENLTRDHSIAAAPWRCTNALTKGIANCEFRIADLGAKREGQSAKPTARTNRTGGNGCHAPLAPFSFVFFFLPFYLRSRSGL